MCFRVAVPAAAALEAANPLGTSVCYGSCSLLLVPPSWRWTGMHGIGDWVRRWWQGDERRRLVACSRISSCLACVPDLMTAAGSRRLRAARHCLAGLRARRKAAVQGAGVPGKYGSSPPGPGRGVATRAAVFRRRRHAIAGGLPGRSTGDAVSTVSMRRGGPCRGGIGDDGSAELSQQLRHGDRISSTMLASPSRVRWRAAATARKTWASREMAVQRCQEVQVVTCPRPGPRPAWTAGDLPRFSIA